MILLGNAPKRKGKNSDILWFTKIIAIIISRKLINHLYEDFQFDVHTWVPKN